MNIEELYRTYFDIVYRYIRSVSQDGSLAEEVTQETFFKALEKIDQFRGDCDVRVRLCQIAKNTLYDHLKKQKKQLLGDEKLEKIESAGGELLEEKLAQRIIDAQAAVDQAKADLADALDELQEAQAACDADSENADLLAARDAVQAKIDELNQTIADNQAILDAAAPEATPAPEEEQPAESGSESETPAE